MGRKSVQVSSLVTSLLIIVSDLMANNTLILFAYKDLLECVSKPVDSLISGVDTFYLIFAGALVFFMQIGKQCIVCTHN